MTREEILALPLDKLNELIAEKMMDEEIWQSSGWDYCGDIKAAWRVEEKMVEKGYAMALDHYPKGNYYCHFQIPALSVIKNWVDGQPSAPEAICRAALLATIEQ
jgi:hypothetical protein